VTSPAGAFIRRWRNHRRMSQMELAFDAGLSPRHVSFIETGRSRPSRDAVLAITEALDVPLRERNVILEAAGHAREYVERPFDHMERTQLRRTVSRLLEHQEPYFAVALDHRSDILAANETADAILASFFDEGGVPGPRNLLRMTLHPRGLRSAILNLAEVEDRLLRGLRRDVALRPRDGTLAELLAELEAYGHAGGGGGITGPVPLILETPAGRVRLLTLVMDFANPLDPLMQEIRLETFLPADEQSARVLESGRSSG
jgi:transcriptional regulator with XRE-family HTH domain